MIKNPDFFIIPRIVAVDKYLQDQDKLVFAAVYWLENLKDGRCTASNQTIADIIGSGNAQSVGNSLSRLEEAKYIKRVFADSPGNLRKEIQSLVKFVHLPSSDGTSHQDMGGLPSVDGNPLPSVDGQNKKTNNKKRKQDSYESVEFNQFWEKYPKKVKKKEAQKAWKKLSPSKELLSEILTAVEAQSKTEAWRKEDGQFVPHPSSWLNGARWQDEVEITKQREIIHFK